ncbi:hypothetical protein [Pseudoalteromonas sp. T1lg23B]|uniref:hypothetical protein n=1 Tax=Pseudoalteromonas sp. T1lg23B TaxID=2077097 RepID=UPI000CF6BABD|nr:hypothetical protein [Pseudoalteromonas sp. T1lg23B]
MRLFAIWLVWLSFASAAEISVYQTFHKDKQEVMLFYPDGNSEFFANGQMAKGASDVKYCHDKQGWRCVYSKHIALAIPLQRDDRPTSWCFAGYKFETVRQANENDMQVLGLNFNSEVEVVISYNPVKGIKHLLLPHLENFDFILSARTGLIGERFSQSVADKAILTKDELSTLLTMCPDYNEQMKNAFKGRLLNLPTIVN